MEVDRPVPARFPQERDQPLALAERVAADDVGPLREQRDAPQQLSEIGVLVLEIGHERRHFERAFPKAEVAWLPTSAGDDEVLLMTRDALVKPAKRMQG